MSARPYASVVFSAYVVPTVPLVDAQVGDPDGPGYVDGKYVGIQGDPEMDIRIRVKLLSAAVEQAWDMGYVPGYSRRSLCPSHLDGARVLLPGPRWRLRI